MQKKHSFNQFNFTHSFNDPQKDQLSPSTLKDRFGSDRHIKRQPQSVQRAPTGLRPVRLYMYIYMVTSNSTLPTI